MKQLPTYVVELIKSGNKYIGGQQNSLWNPMKSRLEFFQVEKTLDVFGEFHYTIRRTLNKVERLYILDIEQTTGRVTWNGTRALYQRLYG